MKSEAEIRDRLTYKQQLQQHWEDRKKTYKEAHRKDMVAFCTGMIDQIALQVIQLKWVLDDPEGETVSDVGRKSD